MLKRPQLFSAHLPSSFMQRMAMSTFRLPGSSPAVPVSLPSDLTKEQLLSFPAFKNWISTLQRSLSLQSRNAAHEFHASPYSLRKIDVQAVDYFGKAKKLGFVKLLAEIRNGHDETLPGSVFLRGPSVGMMVILQPDDIPSTSHAERHVLLTVQPRIPAGSLAFTELPAGMVDDSGTFAGAAAKEIEEELGLQIPASELVSLTEMAISSPEMDSWKDGNDEEGNQEGIERAMFPSAGGCDEFIPLFLHEKRVPREQLKEWTGRLTGLREQGEKITLRLVRLEDLWREGARDSKALGAWALYMGLKAEGKL